MALKNRNYVRGRAFEYRVRDMFRKRGYFVIRSAQSKIIDLVCLRSGRTILVECKTGSSRLKPADRERLKDMTETTGAEILLFRRRKGKRGVMILSLPDMKEVRPNLLEQSPTQKASRSD